METYIVVCTAVCVSELSSADKMDDMCMVYQKMDFASVVPLVHFYPWKLIFFCRAYLALSTAN